MNDKIKEIMAEFRERFGVEKWSRADRWIKEKFLSYGKQEREAGELAEHKRMAIEKVIECDEAHERGVKEGREEMREEAIAAVERAYDDPEIREIDGIKYAKGFEYARKFILEALRSLLKK